MIRTLAGISTSTRLLWWTPITKTYHLRVIPKYHALQMLNRQNIDSQMRKNFQTPFRTSKDRYWLPEIRNFTSLLKWHLKTFPCLSDIFEIIVNNKYALFVWAIRIRCDTADALKLGCHAFETWWSRHRHCQSDFINDRSVIIVQFSLSPNYNDPAIQN